MTTTVQIPSGIGAKMLAGMSYLGILSLVPLVVNREDSYVRFHARQGIILWMWEVLAIYSLAIPGLGRPFFSISGLLCFLFSVFGLASVIMGRAWKLPLIGNWAESI
ncbi:MAG: hypothetical protein HQL76_15245 [Magnetococcales bacterium]|nr:hypothetical protein [Magnetococcales bacterium]